jgi:hypothetical protein
MFPNNARARKIVVTRKVVWVGSEQIQAVRHSNLNHDTQNLFGYFWWRLLTVMPEKMPCLQILP